jgi:hypothetical protein
LDSMCESFQCEIFDAKHVPRFRERTSAGWTRADSLQAKFQGGLHTLKMDPVENMELA